MKKKKRQVQNISKKQKRLTVRPPSELNASLGDGLQSAGFPRPEPAFNRPNVLGILMSASADRLDKESKQK